MRPPSWEHGPTCHVERGRTPESKQLCSANGAQLLKGISTQLNRNGRKERIRENSLKPPLQYRRTWGSSTPQPIRKPTGCYARNDSHKECPADGYKRKAAPNFWGRR